MQKLIFIIPIFFIGCSSVEKLKESKDTKVDSLSETNSSSNLNRWIDSDKYSLEPADLSQPMRFVNSKGEVHEYFNTKVIHEKTIVKEQKKDTIANKTELKKEVEEDKKEVHRDNTMIFLYLFVFLFLVIIFIVWFFGRNINNLTKSLEQIKKTAM